jgi:hypothetical protein
MVREHADANSGARIALYESQDIVVTKLQQSGDVDRRTIDAGCGFAA